MSDAANDSATETRDGAEYPAQQFVDQGTAMEAARRFFDGARDSSLAWATPAFEGHEAMLLLDEELETKLVDALNASDDFQRGGSGFEMVGTPDATNVFETESLASLQPVRPHEWRIIANSTKRYERVLARLAALGGKPVAIRELEVLRPWEVQPGVASEESKNTTRLVVASQRVEVPNRHSAKEAAREVMVDAPHRAIEEYVPAVGGKPRDVAKTPEGRARVESWLQEWELRGLPDDAGWAFVDLDSVRRELDLPTVAERTP